VSRASQAPAGLPRPVAREPAGYDPVLLGAVFALVAVGVVMVYSSSAVYAGSRMGDGAWFLKRQLVAAGLGTVLMVALLRFGHGFLARLAWPLLVVSLLLVAATFVPGLGVRAGGAQRWLKIAGFRFQPSELAKIALAVWLASSVASKGEALRDFKVGFLPHAAVCGLLGALVLAQRDFGAMVVVLVLMLAVLFVAGARLTYVFVAIGIAVPAGWWLVVSTPYRMRRIEAFLDPFADRFGAGYQVAESLMSVGSGGLFGLGLGEGRQKLGYLPAGHTDYILASIGEELGLVGIAAVLLLMGVVVWRGLRAARRAADPFGAYLAFGLVTLLAVETAINAGMCLGLLPPKGMALPYLSYGGTQLVKSMILSGLLLSVSGDGGGFLVPPAGAVRCS